MYKTINGWTKQSMREHVVANFKGKSLRPATALGPTLCMYRGPEGKKCAMGIFIPDELYHPNMEGAAAFSLLESQGTQYNSELEKVMPLDAGGMMQLQSQHDQNLFEVEEDSNVLARILEFIDTQVEDFALVERSQDSELEELVKTANAGIKADQEIAARFPGQVQSFYADGDTAIVNKDKTQKSTYGFVLTDLIRYEILPKPAFEPFTTSNGWRVTLEGGKLTIGCKEFKVHSLMNDVLPLLLDMNQDKALKYGQYRATRIGILHEEKILPWADAEELYKRLKEVVK